MVLTGLGVGGRGVHPNKEGGGGGGGVRSEFISVTHKCNTFSTIF